MEKVIIIGGGIAGYTLAKELSKGDFDITLIEKKDLGGVCLNLGCIPTKSLLHLTESEKNLDLITEKTNEVIIRLREGVRSLLSNSKIEIINGEAKILNDKKIEVNDKKFNYDILVLANGSTPIIPSFINCDYLTSDNICSLKTISGKMVILGGGYIGVEMATVFNRLGCEVTIIEKEDSLLPGINQEIGKRLTLSLKKKGIIIKTSCPVLSAENKELKTEIENFEFDNLFVCLGRKPSSINSEIEFEKIENGNLKLSNSFETSIENIYAIGDLTGNIMLAHKAEYDAKILAQRLLGKKVDPNYSQVPFCVYSDPQVAIVGDVKGEKSIRIPFGINGMSHCKESIEGLLKLFFDKDKQIIGGIAINHDVQEVLAVLTIAIKQGMNLKDLSEVLFAHPTVSEIFKEANNLVK